MVIVVGGVKKRGRFAFRFLVKYVARQSGVAAVRVAGGLDPKGSPDDWIRQFEERASKANCTSAALHIIVSPTEQEAMLLGQNGLANMMNEVAKHLDLHNNQRLAAVHVDSTHRHLHGVYSRVKPDLSVASAERNDRHVLRRLARAWEQRLGTATQRDDNARLAAGAGNLESWTLLPSFSRWIRIAGAHVGLADSTTPEEYSQKLARLGIWPERTTSGVVLATMHDDNIVRAKASASGFSPPSSWQLDPPHTTLHQPSAYQRAVQATKTSMMLRDPLYAQFLRDRERWLTTGRTRARAIREALRSERRAFDLDCSAALPNLSEREARIIRLATQHARSEMLAAHARARAEIASARPPSQYGAWLRHRERSGDVAAGLSRSGARTTEAQRLSQDPADHRSPRMTAEFERFVHAQAQAAMGLPMVRIPRTQALDDLGRVQTLSQDVDGRRRVAEAIADLTASPDDGVELLLQSAHTPDEIVRALLEAAEEKRLRRKAQNRDAGGAATTHGDPGGNDVIEAPGDRAPSRESPVQPGPVDEILRATTGIFRGAGGTRRQPKPPSTKASRWASRLRHIDAAERAALAELDAKTTRSDKGFAESIVALQTIVKRARVHCEEYPLVAVAGELAHAPEPRFRSEGSRFDHDRLARVMATMDVVATTHPSGETSAAAFLEDATLPAFTVTDAGYHYGPLTGVHPDSLAVGLLAAQRRFESVHIEGNAAFVEAALTTAAQLGIAVANADLQTQWQRLHAEFRRTDVVRAAAIAGRQASLSTAYERAVFTVFGRPAEVLSLQDLTASPVRVTAEVSLRAVFPVGDTQYAVFEAPGGRLQALELTPALRADNQMGAALASAPWANTLAVSTGAGQPIDIASSPEREASIAQRASRRRTHTRLFREAQSALDARVATIAHDRAIPQDLDRRGAADRARDRRSVIDRDPDERTERSI